MGTAVHGDSPGKNTGMGCHALLRGIFPTWGWNTSLMFPALADVSFTTSAAWEALGAMSPRFKGQLAIVGPCTSRYGCALCFPSVMLGEDDN